MRKFVVGYPLFCPSRISPFPDGVHSGQLFALELLEVRYGRYLFQRRCKINERFHLKYELDVFNLFNHPSFDAPNNNVTLNPCFNPNPCYTNPPPSTQNIGYITDTIGVPRFIQMALHLTF